MAATLNVVLYIILCLWIGIVLTLLPWIPQDTLGLSDWGNNYFLLYAARKTGSYALQTAVSSGWMRGAVTGIGLLNLGIAFWEIFHFRQSVSAIQANHGPSAGSKIDAERYPSSTATAEATDLSHHERPDDAPDNSGN